MQENLETIIAEECMKWTYSEEHKELSERLEKLLKERKAYDDEVESALTCLEAQILDDGITIGMIKALYILKELEHYDSKYRK